MRLTLNKNHKPNRAGFTLVEIVVATTIFAIVVTSLLALFNYTLKINRKSEALRQAAQGMRNFVEFLVKEVRNGQIDYFVNGGTNPALPLGPCGPPGTIGANTYFPQDNRLGILNTDNVAECFYLGDANNAYVGNSSVFDGSTLILQKENISSPQILNPSNFQIAKLMFLIRPTCDPFGSACNDYGSSYPKIQPFVTILMKFVAHLPTGEQVTINYQTSVSTQKYDIPGQP